MALITEQILFEVNRKAAPLLVDIHAQIIRHFAAIQNI